MLDMSSIYLILSKKIKELFEEGSFLEVEDNWDKPYYPTEYIVHIGIGKKTIKSKGTQIETKYVVNRGTDSNYRLIFKFHNLNIKCYLENLVEFEAFWVKTLKEK